MHMGCLHYGLCLVMASLDPWSSSGQLGVVVSICHQHASPRKVCHPIPLWYGKHLDTAWMLQLVWLYSKDVAIC